MKSLILSLFLLIVCQCLGQSNSVSAGATVSKQEGADAGIGFFIGGNVDGKLTDYIGYFGSAQFINYNNKLGDISVKYYGIEPTFAFTIWPTKEKFAVLVGSSVSYLIKGKIDDVKGDVNRAYIHFTAGATFEINDKMFIQARYSIPYDSDNFKFTSQVGFYYRLN